MTRREKLRSSGAKRSMPSSCAFREKEIGCWPYRLKSKVKYRHRSSNYRIKQRNLRGNKKTRKGVKKRKLNRIPRKHNRG